MLTDKEINEWCSLLVDTKKTTKEIIQELIRHAWGDDMSEEDKAVCKRALKLIDLGVIKNNPARQVEPNNRVEGISDVD